MELPAQIGKYELQEFLGGGTMSRVYRAIDTLIGRTVVVKILTEAGTQPKSKSDFSPKRAWPAVSTTTTSSAFTISARMIATGPTW
jgi:hypothetical protein